VEVDQKVVQQVHLQDQVIQVVLGVEDLHKQQELVEQEIHHQQTLLKETMEQQELMPHLIIEVVVEEVLVQQAQMEHLQE
jgi:hypothetical protein